MSSDTYIHRLMDQLLDQLMPELAAVMISGPRGCGKTTTALRHASSALRFDQPDQATAFQLAPDAVLAAQAPPVLLDEWQDAPDSLAAVKRAVDAGSGGGRFVLTGSVRGRQSSIGWPATGRVIPLDMYGLTQGELEGASSAGDGLSILFTPDALETSELADAPDLVDYVQMIVRGGFPDTIGLTELARSAWYEGYLDQLVRHDVAGLETVRSPAALSSLVRAVALNTAGLPSASALAEFSHSDRRTAASYLDLLEDLSIVARLPAWGTSRLNRLIKTPKLYMVDTGMAAHLTGDNVHSLLKSGDRVGRLVDTFVMAQLRPLLRFRAPAVAAYHLRDSAGRREVDIVLESADGRIVGVEVKAANTATVHDARHLAWLRDQLGGDFVHGVVLHTGSMTYPLGERLIALPIARLWRG